MDRVEHDDDDWNISKFLHMTDAWGNIWMY